MATRCPDEHRRPMVLRYVFCLFVCLFFQRENRASILNYEDVKTEVRRLIRKYWNEAQIDNKYCSKWKLMKFEIAKYLRKYSSDLAKRRNAEEDEIVSTITSLSQKPLDYLSTNEKEILTEYQNKLDNLYMLKAKGAFIRSRQKWMEEGERNSAYFFRLEKSHSKTNSIQQLKIDNTLCDNPKLIATYCSNVYSKLNTSQYCERSASAFLDSVEVNNINDAEICVMLL